MKNNRIGGSHVVLLNKRELKPINAYLMAQYGTTLPEGFAYLLSAKENLYAVTRSLDALPLRQLRIMSIGLYLGEWKNHELRLSIEGSQLLGPKAVRHVVPIAPGQVLGWMRGESLQAELDAKGFVIVKAGTDFIGAGRIKAGLLLNYIPKSRRLQEIA